MKKDIFKNKKFIILIIFIILVLFIYNFYEGKGKFIETGSMNVPRIAHAATLLNDGRVLITGGYCVGWKKAGIDCPKSAEIYDPKTGKFTLTGSMNYPRVYHTATLLKDGRVLIVSGLPREEIYDPKTGKFTLTGSMIMKPTIAYGIPLTATLLKDGRVLVIGEFTKITPNETRAEIYNPELGTFHQVEEIKDMLRKNVYVDYDSHTATLLPDGKVLIAGGFLIQNAELYNPVTTKFTVTGKTIEPFNNFTATLLNKNKVLFAGNTKEINVNLYDIKKGTFEDSKNTMKGVCGTFSVCTATLLKNGKVLILGTNRSKQELYDPVKDEFIDTGRVKLNSFWHTATLLRNGDVLITGGSKRASLWAVASSNRAMLYRY